MLITLSLMVPACDHDSVDTPRRPQPIQTPPPSGAIVLWNGADTNQWIMANGDRCAWEVSGRDLVVASGTGDLLSAMPLGTGHYHIEWLSPPGGSRWGQRNGNSGIKIASRYELQILNTPAVGQTGDLPNDEAGSIYDYRAPDVNASSGSGTWQSYDIHYTAPVWQNGTKQADARLTVYWNGILIHNDVTMTAATGASAEEDASPRPLLLQDHASTAAPVRFRNIWHLPSDQSHSHLIRSMDPKPQ